ncbi:hypothetical protein ACFPK5_22180 [Streptomyces beijiangensis]|uniref:hypothetical protein n=1 Tax=Streptomyces beijiangensis TaxID=163361 RepID=UPI0031D969FF
MPLPPAVPHTAKARLRSRPSANRAARFIATDGPWDRWVGALEYLQGDPGYSPARQRQWLDGQAAFADGWSHR